jgi:O-methyltransferase involved in polyketide biosynthesis
MARTDGDTWDLTSSVGATATGVAAGRALASRGPNPLLDDPFAEPLVKAVGSDVFIKLVNGEMCQISMPPTVLPFPMTKAVKRSPTSSSSPQH